MLHGGDGDGSDDDFSDMALGKDHDGVLFYSPSETLGEYLAIPQ